MLFQQKNKDASKDFGPFQLQITASVCERPLRKTAAPTWPAAAVREPTLLFVAEMGTKVIMIGVTIMDHGFV